MRALIFLLAATSVQAEFMDGNTLLADMNGSQMRQASSIGYVMGVADTLHSVSFCPPQQATAGQVHDMVKQYLVENPSQRHHTGDTIVKHVLSRTWPCRQTQQRGSGV